MRFRLLPRVLARWSVVACAAALLAACAVNPLPTPGADANGAGGGIFGPGDDKVPTGLDAVGGVAPDAPLPAADVPPVDSAFCADEGRVALDDAVFAPVSATTGEVVMDCCSGFVVRFHAAAAAGVDLSVTVVVMGAGPYAGEFDLAHLPEGVGVTVHSGSPADEPWTWAAFEGALAGTLTVTDEGAPPTRRVVSLCLSGERAPSAADAPFQRVRLHAADLGLLVPWGGGERGFALHLLADPDTTAVAAAALPLADLELAPAALVDLNHVEFYEWAAHRVALAGWHNGEFVRNTLPPVGPQGLPFVVLSGEERLYLGAFWTMESSEAFAHPVVVLESIERAGFALEAGYAAAGDPGAAEPPADPRSDPRLESALRHLGKLAE